MLRCITGCLVLLALLSNFATAASFLVRPDGTGDFNLIQLAVDAAATTGDTIFVDSGAYGEAVIVSGKSLTAIGINGSTQTSTTSFSVSGASSGTYRGFTLATASTFSTGFRLHLVDITALGFLMSEDQNIEATADSCIFHAGATMNTDLVGSSVDVTDCSFLGGDLTSTGLGNALIHSTEFQNGNIVLRVEGYVGMEGVTVANGSIDVVVKDEIVGHADISSSSASGSFDIVSGRRALVTDNSAGGEILVIARESHVERNAAATIDVRAADSFEPVELEVRDNLVVGGSTGLQLLISPDGPALVTGNTVVDCAQRGIRMPGFGNPLIVERNLVVDCGIGIDFSIGVPGNTTLGCNNVWESTTANWSGVADPTGADGNISVDPFFCDAPGGDYELAVNSRCLPGNHPDGAMCGQIGALGSGCGVVSVASGAAGIPSPFRVHPNPTVFPVAFESISGAHSRRTIEVFDVSGRRVHALELAPGVSRQTWDGTTDDGRIAPGTYFVRLDRVGTATRIVVLP